MLDLKALNGKIDFGYWWNLIQFQNQFDTKS